jgi:hypothetical protein
MIFYLEAQLQLLNYISYNPISAVFAVLDNFGYNKNKF